MSLRLALEAMATRFELVILDEGEPQRLRAIGEQALAEITRAERLWSRFQPTSEIAWINAAAGGAPVRVSPPTFELLAECKALARETSYAFDPTIGPLLRAWGVAGPPLERPPDAAAVAAARRLTGMQRVELDEAERSVRLSARGMELDLGAVAKGSALDAAVNVLREHGIASALLHGGTSSIHALGATPEGPWRIGWALPGDAAPVVVTLDGARPALSVSAPHGRRIAAGSTSWGHVIDPRTGAPAPEGSALVSGPRSAICDALSTALLVLGRTGPGLLGGRFPAYSARMSTVPATLKHSA